MATAHPLKRGFSDTAAKMLGGAQISFRRRTVGALIGIRLRARPKPEAESIQVVLRSFGRMVPWRQAEIDPVHAVLRGEERNLDQRRQFVAGTRARVGEPGGNFILPSKALDHDCMGGCLLECFERRRNVACVSRRAEDDRFGRGQVAPARLRFLDAQEQGFGVLNLLHASFHGLGLSPSVTVTAVVNDTD